MALTATTIDALHQQRELLRRLLEVHGTSEDSDQILSIYVNLDPRDFATAPARQTELTSLLDEAERTAPDSRWNEVIEDIRSRFEAASYEVDNAHGLAIICTRDRSLFEIVKLPRPVERRVGYGRFAHIRPLVESLPRETWCALLVNRRSARVLLGSRHELHQVARIDDEVHGQHDQGGWSQARYQRGIEKEVHDHLKNVAGWVFRLLQSQHFDQLVIAAPAEMHGDLLEIQHPYVREHFVDWFDVDVENSSDTDVHQAALSVIEEHESRQQQQVLDLVRQEVGRGGRGAAGLDAVLAALNERAVARLLIAEGFAERGQQCPECGFLAAGDGDSTCPADGHGLVSCDDVVEAAVERAVLQSADVLNIGRDGALTRAAHARVGSGGNGNGAHSGNGTDGEGVRQQYLELVGHGSVAAVLRWPLTGATSTTEDDGTLRQG